MNRGSFIGNLTRDPETRTIQKMGNETTVTNFVVAAAFGFGDFRHTEYIKIAAWNGLGKTCAQYLRKGSKVYVAGPVTANAYINSEGNAVGTIEMRLEEVEFLSAKPTETNDNPIVEEDSDNSDEDIEDLL